MASVYDESYKELKEFVEWFNRIYGLHPIIIGGWAVYHYNSYFQSKDIDVVFEFPRRAWDQQLLSYFSAHGYKMLDQKKSGAAGESTSTALVQTFRKRVNGDYIDVDACSTTDSNAFVKKQYSGLRVPYSFLPKKVIEATVPGTRAVYRIPRIELLLLYKIKAYSDRDELSKNAGKEEEVRWLQSKRDKDGADVIALFDEKNCRQKIDFKNLQKMVGSLGLSEPVLETLERVFSNNASINAYARIAVHDAADLYQEAMRKISSPQNTKQKSRF